MTRPWRQLALEGALLGWFVLTVAGQKLYRPPHARSRWDRVHAVVPDWRFFAPDPGVYDHHVLTRGVRADGTATPWREITHVEPRRLLHAVWHPRQRAEKATFDVCAELLRFLDRQRASHVPAEETRRAVQLSLPYLTLLALAGSVGPGPGVVATQFMVAISGGSDEEPPEVVFVSEVHPVDDPPPDVIRRRAGGDQPPKPLPKEMP